MTDNNSTETITTVGTGSVPTWESSIAIEVGDDLRKAWPQFRGLAVFANVKNSQYDPMLWKRIEQFTDEYRKQFTTDSIKLMPAIQATRQAYKKCGKDPSRYRPSAEALCRRILRGIPLYQIDTLVDLINLVSISSGFSIGGFDRDKIKGKRLVLGIGKAGEPYEGIGRGQLNIEGMPVYRDEEGGIGTPTSDHERTKISLDTSRLLCLINGYSGSQGLEQCASLMAELLRNHAAATDIQFLHYE